MAALAVGFLPPTRCVGEEAYPASTLLNLRGNVGLGLADAETTCCRTNAGAIHLEIPGQFKRLMQRSLSRNFLFCSSGVLCLTLSGLSPSEQAPVRYVDISGSSGLRFQHLNS